MHKGGRGGDIVVTDTALHLCCDLIFSHLTISRLTIATAALAEISRGLGKLHV